jgi:hypothetical protein
MTGIFMNKAIFWMVISMSFGSQAIAASLQVDKWTDDQGNTHYGQRPMTEKALKDQAKNQLSTSKAAITYIQPVTKHKDPRDYSQNDH